MEGRLGISRFRSSFSGTVAPVERLQPAVVVMGLSYASGNLPGLVHELRNQAPAAQLLLLSVLR
jgi:hypothetical protein